MPSRTASATSRAILATTSASRPTDPPPNISPESLSKTRRAAGESIESVVLVSDTRSSWRRGRFSAYGLCLGSHTEPSEGGHLAAGGLHDLADGGGVVLGELLLEEHVLLEPAIEAALDDLGKGGL